MELSITTKWEVNSSITTAFKSIVKVNASPMTHMGQHRQIAGRSCQVTTTTQSLKKRLWNHRETYGHGKNVVNRDNPQPSPKVERQWMQLRD